MKIQLTLTAVADRDPSCNLFTLTEMHTRSLSRGFNAAQIKQLCAEHKEKFIAAWPHPRNACPIIIPIDADVRTVER